MPSCPKVNLDFHGVVVDALGAKYALACEQTQLDIPRLEFNGRGIIGKKFPHRAFQQDHRVFTEADYGKVKAEIYDRRDGFRHLKPMPGARQAIIALVNAGCFIKIVSNLPIRHRGKVIELLKRESIPYHDVQLTDGKPKTSEYEDSAFVIDDELRHLKPVAGKVQSAILMLPCEGATGFNALKAPPSVPDGVQLVREWKEALATCMSLLAAA